jgi:hypothetical protein
LFLSYNKIKKWLLVQPTNFKLCLEGIVKVDKLGMKRQCWPLLFMSVLGFIEELFSSSSLDSGT